MQEESLLSESPEKPREMKNPQTVTAEWIMSKEKEEGRERTKRKEEGGERKKVGKSMF